MQAVIRKIVVLIFITVAGCAPTPPPSPVSPTIPGEAGHPVYLDAEKAFHAGQYALALDRYQAFLREAYDAPYADVTLFRIGKIFQLTGRDDDALSVFSRLRHEFPQSALISDTVLETLNIYFSQEDYESVVNVGTAFIGTADSKIRRTPFYTVIAKAYEAMNAHLDAARYRYQALVNATDDEKAAAWDNVQKSVEQLGADEIRTLVSGVSDHETMGYLLYRLGMALIMEEKYDDAMDILLAFVDQFPSHPDHQDASDMILFLVERSRFKPFTVGCVLPLSGPYGLFGRRAMDGVEFALSRLDATIDGMPFDVVVKDSRSDPEVSIAAIEELDQRKVGVILGPMAVSDTAAAMAQKRGIPIVVFTQKEGVADIGPYVFRNFITPQMQVQALVSFAIDELGVNRFAILYPDEHYGHRYMDLFWDQVIDHGRVVTGVEAYDPQSTDFAAPIKKLAGIYYDIPRDLIFNSQPKAGVLSLSLDEGRVSGTGRIMDLGLLDSLIGIPLDSDTIDRLTHRNSDREDQWHPVVDFDAIFIPDAPKKAGLVIPQLAYYDIRDVYLLGTNLWNSQTLLDMSGDYMKSTLVVDGFFAQSRDDTIKAFVDGFKRIYDRTPGIIEAVAYDSTMMAFQTMRQHATDSRREIKTALLQLDEFPGVSGRTRFAPNGEARKSMRMLRIRNGQFVEAGPTSEPSTLDARPQH